MAPAAPALVLQFIVAFYIPIYPQISQKTHLFDVLRHDYLVVSGKTYSFQKTGSLLWSKGIVYQDDENPNRDYCSVIGSDDDHDKYVQDVIAESSVPQYGVGFWATDCQEWANNVLELASDRYDNDISRTIWGHIRSSVRDIFWYGD